MEFNEEDFKDPKQFFEELVKKAMDGKPSEFEFIRSYQMLQTARLYKHGVKKVAKLFKTLSDSLFEQYSDKIINDAQDVEALLAAKQFEMCYDFYTKEFNLAKDMISEYRAYAFSGHLLDQFVFGGIRAESECVDFRKLPWKLF